MIAKARVRAIIRGTDTPLLLPPELLAWEVADGGGRVEVAAWKQAVKKVSILREETRTGGTTR